MVSLGGYQTLGPTFTHTHSYVALSYSVLSFSGMSTRPNGWCDCDPTLSFNPGTGLVLVNTLSRGCDNYQPTRISTHATGTEVLNQPRQRHGLPLPLPSTLPSYSMYSHRQHHSMCLMQKWIRHGPDYGHRLAPEPSYGYRPHSWNPHSHTTVMTSTEAGVGY